MPSASSTQFKLGLFTLLAIAALGAVAFGLGLRATKHETIAVHTYFDESVQGLDVGAPVKFRGVPIGSVAAIRIAPDHRLVDVTLGVKAADARRLGLLSSQPGLFAQLEAQGITGVMLIDIDFLDSKNIPVPALSFPPEQPYIPGAPSILKGLEESLGTVANRLPALMDATVGALHELAQLISRFGDEGVIERFGKTLDDVNGAVGQLNALARRANRVDVVGEAATAIGRVNVVVAKLGDMVDHVSGDSGLLASARRATESIGELGRRTSGATADLDRTLRDLAEAARAVRDLAQDLDREPDMLLKGRASAQGP